MIRLQKDIGEAIEHGQTVVVPSRQRSQAVHLACAAAALGGGRRVWATPDVLPLEGWIGREIERRAVLGDKVPRLLTSAEEWLLWRQSAAQLTDDLKLAARGPLAEALRRASQLALEFGIETERLNEAAGSEARLLHAVERAVIERCRALDVATPVQFATALACLGADTPLVLSGFTPLPPYLETIASIRRARGYDTRVRLPAGSAEHAARTVYAADAAEELERIAQWCRTRLDAQPDARLLVLLPGAPEARERLIALISQSIDPRGAVSADPTTTGQAALAEIEGGAPFARVPLVAHALQSLKWLTQGAEFADVSAWLCAPYWTTPDGARARLDVWLREHATLEIDSRVLLAALGSSPATLKVDAQHFAGQITHAARALGTGSASPRQWSERFRAALAALGWPGSRTSSSDDEQTRARFAELLDDFGQLAAAAPSIARDTAAQWFTELALRTTFRPASGDPVVTVSPVLADPVVRYDGVWVAGLHADVWPPPVQPDPFLPLGAQLAAGVPAASAVGRAQEARALMRAWADAADELVLSSPLRADDVQLSPSPLLAAYASRATTGENRTQPWLPRRLRREGLTETLIDRIGLPWDVSRPLPRGTKSVDLQNACPFHAYGELRLGCSDLEAPEPGIAAKLRGQLLHAALDKLWQVLGDSRTLLAHSEEGLDDIIARCVSKAAEATLGPAAEGARAPAEQRECRRAQRLIRRLCRLERQRTPFVVQETELERPLPVGGAQMRVRIDRLDALATGGLAILDYKSGRRIPGDWYAARPAHPQLLAYLAAVGAETVAIATVSITAKEIRFDGVAAAAGLLPTVRPVERPAGIDSELAWDRQRREWLACVERLATDFVAGIATVDPLPRACDYCQVASVCRIADRTAAVADTDEAADAGELLEVTEFPHLIRIPGAGRDD